MIRTQIQLTEGQSWALKELALQEDLPEAELIRRAVNHWLQMRRGVSMEERRKRAVEVIGRFHSGSSDVSEQHDKYLAEAYGEWTSS